MMSECLCSSRFKFSSYKHDVGLLYVISCCVDSVPLSILLWQSNLKEVISTDVPNLFCFLLFQFFWEGVCYLMLVFSFVVKYSDFEEVIMMETNFIRRFLLKLG